jgi:pyridoxal phosphate enzyme (YggS family)
MIIPGSLARVRQRIAAAAARAGRSPGEVTLIGVTKTVPTEAIRAAVAAGLGHIGENRVQEAAAKREALAALSPRPQWHLIGHLQSNKVTRAAALFDCIHSIDSEELARRLDRAAGARGATIDVLIQVDLGLEATKHGAEEKDVAVLARTTAALPHLRLKGLMTIPPLSETPEGSRRYFRRLRELRDEVAAGGPPLPELSMGMSFDLDVAVEEGATMIRVGRALFGERPDPIG